jgi:putative ABC transport system permease protein
MQTTSPSLESPSEAGSVSPFSGGWADLRHALRRLGKTRGFTAVTLLTLALCIGANTAIFSMVYALLLKPLPFPQPERIVEIYNTFVKAGLNKAPSNVVQYLDYQQNAKSFDQLGLWTLGQGLLGEDGAQERIFGARATADLFELLGLKPVVGAFFTAENSRPATDKVVVLAQSFWQTQYQEDPGVVGPSRPSTPACAMCARSPGCRRTSTRRRGTRSVCSCSAA